MLLKCGVRVDIVGDLLCGTLKSTLRRFCAAARPVHTGLVCLSTESCPGVDSARLSAAGAFVSNRLYICLLGTWNPSFSTVLQRVGGLYDLGGRRHPDLDIRVLLPSCTTTASDPHCIVPELDALLGPKPEELGLTKLNASREAAGLAPVHFMRIDAPSISTCDEELEISREESVKLECKSVALSSFPTVVLGGTFDRLHAGHKLLLSAAALLSSKKVIVGVAGQQLLRKKKAALLIEPVALRSTVVSLFLQSIKPSLQIDVRAILDPVGTAGTEPDIDCIVVSAETAAGGHYCNRVRAENGLEPMKVVVAPLVSNTDSSALRESAVDEKISSSGLRMAELGTFRGNAREWSRRTSPRLPYLLGLTGGIASGKSNILRALRERGVAVLDMDKLGHEAYLPGTKCFDELVHEFGNRIVSDDGTVNRSAIGRIVFGDSSGAARRRMERIVWPAIAELRRNHLEEFQREGHDIVVVEAAVLLEAGLDSEVDEVWCVTTSVEEQCRRVMARNGLTQVEAEARIASQMSSEDRVKRSHVVFDSSGPLAATARQAIFAYEGARLRSQLDCAKSLRSQAELDADVTAPLSERFAALVASIGGTEECTRKWWRILHDHHCEAHRRYHNLEHLREFHERLRYFKAQGLRSSAACELALFFHDVIYDPTRHDNEAKSAQLFTRFCVDLRDCIHAEGLPLALHLEEVCGLILRTAYHMEGPADGDMGAFLDCDLQVLGYEPAAYARYAEQIRLEYAFVPEVAYRKGRADVLRRFLEQKSLYFTTVIQNAAESIARANIASEVKRLLQ